MAEELCDVGDIVAAGDNQRFFGAPFAALGHPNIGQQAVANTFASDRLFLAPTFVCVGRDLLTRTTPADAAVDAILRDDLPGYEGEWRRITRSYRRLTGSLLWVSSRSSLRPLIVPTARAVPSIFGRIVDSLAR